MRSLSRSSARPTTPNGSPYSSGDAKGTGHAIPNYARVEVVGRGPAETGLWPCVLWPRPLLGSDADAPSGFDWQRIFENPQQRWYPRVTLQIGCGIANPTCATGNPDSSFAQTDMLVTQLRIYQPAS